MLIITLQRDKCIGCNFCKENAPQFFRLSKKDGKAILLNSKESKGFHTSYNKQEEGWEDLEIASRSCPVRIIKVSKKLLVS